MKNENDKIFLEKLNNVEKNILSAQEYIKENYQVDSRYDNEDDIIYIWSIDENNDSKLIEAKNYIFDNIGKEFVEVIFGE